MKRNEKNCAFSIGETDLSANLIEEQLERILCSPEFQATDTQKDFLRFVVEETIAGRAHEIKGYTVATKVFGRKEDFDSTTDPIVSIQANRLRLALERYYLVAGEQDPIRIDIPKGTYVPNFLRQTDETLGEKTSSAELEVPIHMTAIKPTIAVIPLTDLTEDKKQAYFALGLTEELATELIRYQSLQVITCRPEPQVHSFHIDAKRVGREWGVSYLMVGSVRKDEETVKIAVRLIDTTTGVYVWGNQYSSDATAANMIAIQEQIAGEIVARIGGRYGFLTRKLSQESRKKAPATFDAYEAMLMYHHYESGPDPLAFENTLQALERAVKKDPKYAPAWAALADMYAENYRLQITGTRTSLDEALKFARRGTELEPENQFVRSKLAWIHFQRNDKERFFIEAERGLALNPNAATYVGFFGWTMVLLGEWDRGLAFLERGIKCNPNYPRWFHTGLCLYYLRGKQYRKAYQEALKYDAPGVFWDPLLRAATLGQMGKEKQAKDAADELIALRPDFPTKGKWLISCDVKVDDLVAQLIEGLRKAGITCN